MFKKQKVIIVLNQEKNGSKKIQLKTFRQCCQKFGHVSIAHHDLFWDVNQVKQYVYWAKRLNVKLTCQSGLESLHELLKNNKKDLHEIFEHIDILGLQIEGSHQNNLIQTMVKEAREFNCTVYLYTDLQDDQNILFSIPKDLPIEHWIIDGKEDEQIQSVIELNPHLEMIKDYKEFYVNDYGDIIETKTNTVVAHISQSSSTIYHNLKPHCPKLINQLSEEKCFPHVINQKYLDSISKKIRSGKAIFFDIEAVSRKSTNSEKHKITDYPVPILFSLLRIDKGVLKVAERFDYSTTNVSNLHTIYETFFNYVKKEDIMYLVVSNGDLEQRFIENCIFYLRKKLSIEDVRYLIKMRDQIIDIQQVLDKRLNSFNLLTELKVIYPDLITFSRKADKLSIKINFILDGLIFGPKEYPQKLQKIIDYCYEDVYADFELFKFYDYIQAHKLI